MTDIRIRKLAGKYGLKCDTGYAYGTYQGFDLCVTVFAQEINLIVYAHTDTAGEDSAYELRRYLRGADLKKKYRINHSTVLDGDVMVNFKDLPGSIGKLEAFLEELLVFLPKYGFSSDYCPHCGKPLNGAGRWYGEKLMDPMHLHPECAEAMNQKFAEDYPKEKAKNEKAKKEAQAKNQKKKENHRTGLFAALLAALCGAVAIGLAFDKAATYFLLMLCLVGLVCEAIYFHFYQRCNLRTVVSILFACFVSVALGLLPAMLQARAWYLYLCKYTPIIWASALFSLLMDRDRVKREEAKEAIKYETYETKIRELK